MLFSFFLISIKIEKEIQYRNYDTNFTHYYGVILLQAGKFINKIDDTNLRIVSF
jgi:hypothetical protein